MTEKSWAQAHRCGDHFSCTIHLDQKHGSKNCGKLTWHFCMCCNPAKWEGGIWGRLAYKTQRHNYGWNESLSADQDQTKKKIIAGLCLGALSRWWSRRLIFYLDQGFSNFFVLRPFKYIYKILQPSTHLEFFFVPKSKSIFLLLSIFLWKFEHKII